ncbi:alpha-xylosidase [Dactylosporangium sp. CA-052675]|uniref:alpha-xylosidase n=1 Tax=Dactylosporangium sp. CA-052675 TaxID=3239927 RepID=UPI003D8CF229
MKFNDGYWLLREGVTARYATDALDVRTSDASASIAVLTKRNEHRGSVLNTPTITVELSAPAPDVVRVRASHRAVVEPPSVGFEISPDPVEVRVERDDATVRVTAGRLSAEAAAAGPWGLRFLGAGTALTSSGFKSLASMTDAAAGDFMIERLTLPVGANVYGFGERFTPFVKNGQVVDTWNQDGGTASEQAYKSVPFFVTDAGFGVFVNSPARVSFEVASEIVSAVQFSTPGPQLEYLVIYGPTPAEILRRYTALTGRPALPPRWSFGLWLSTSFTTDYDEATVTHFVEGMAQRDLPLSVIHFDCYWMRALHWCDFEWDRRVFPEPDEMLRRLGDRGLRRSVWINPYIGQRSPVFQEAAEAGYLLHRPDGTVWQSDLWVAGMGIVDFTNPAAREWFAGKVRALLESGVDAVKTDFGERIPTDVVWFDGSDPQLMHNYYPLLYNRTVFDELRRHRGEGEAVVFARSATVGGQQFPVHWGGDCESTYTAMADSLRGGLSLGLGGFGFWSHDIGGFEGTPSAALFKRWVAFGLLSSHSRLHGSDSYRVPWAFDEEAVAVTRRFARLKNALMPYLWAAAVDAHRRGIPVMRAMLLEFPQDRTSSFLDRQYMLGPDLLVAPVFSDEGDVEFYLPGGVWTSYLDGTTVSGPGWVRQRHDFSSLPLLVRPGAVIPLGARTDRPDYDDALAPVFEVFGMADGDRRVATLFDAAGAERVVVEVSRTGSQLRAVVTRGLEHLTEGWTVCWVTGPRGPGRGPRASASATEQTLTLAVD